MIKLNGKNLDNGVFEVAQLDRNCRYGSKSFPGSKEIAQYAIETPSVKAFKLAGTEFTFPADLATPTIGTWVTKGNKIINGVDPSERESIASSGSSGGGRSRAKISAHIEGDNLVLVEGETSALISAESISISPESSNALAVKALAVVRDFRKGEFATVQALVSKPHLIAMVEEIKVDMGEHEEVTEEAKQGAIASLAGAIQSSGKFELFGKLAKATYKLVGGDIEVIKAWAELNFPVVMTEAAPAE